MTDEEPGNFDFFVTDSETITFLDTYVGVRYALGNTTDTVTLTDSESATYDWIAVAWRRSVRVSWHGHTVRLGHIGEPL